GLMEGRALRASAGEEFYQASRSSASSPRYGWLWRGRRRVVFLLKAINFPPPRSLFPFCPIFSLFFRGLGRPLPLRVGNDLVNPSPRVSPNIPQLRSCFIDDRRNLGELFRGQIEVGT